MRIALFADIHGNISGLKAVLARIHQLGGAELIFAAGDHLGGGGGGQDLLDLLFESDVVLLRGNHEELALDIEANLIKVTPTWRDWAQRSVEWLHQRITSPYWQQIAALPLYHELAFEDDASMIICHATPQDPWSRVCAHFAPVEDLQSAYGAIDADLVAYGHYHQQHILPLSGKTLLNVASVGLRNDGHSAFTLLERTNGSWSIEQHLTPYDMHEEARLMKARGVPLP
jgi:predicted phosphodiesterase